MVVTKGGDVIQIILKEEVEQKNNSLTYYPLTERINNIFQLKGDLKAMCLQEMVLRSLSDSPGRRQYPLHRRQQNCDLRVLTPIA